MMRPNGTRVHAERVVVSISLPLVQHDTPFLQERQEPLFPETREVFQATLAGRARASTLKPVNTDETCVVLR